MREPHYGIGGVQENMIVLLFTVIGLLKEDGIGAI